ncbi:unnamed protein product [Closterium sp. NIES-54]
MALRPSSVPQCVPLPSPFASSLVVSPDPESDLVRVTSTTVSRLLATVVTDPSFESAAASALVAELVEFAAALRLDYAASLVAGSESDCPPSVGGECALGTDVLEDRQEDFECLTTAVPHLVSMLIAPEGDPDAPDIPTPRSYAEAITGPYSSQWQTPMDAKMASWKSRGTYVNAVPPPRANIVDGMWIFRVKRPPGSPPAFKARYVARGFSQQQGVDFFHTFSPNPKMTTLWQGEREEEAWQQLLLRRHIRQTLTPSPRHPHGGGGGGGGGQGRSCACDCRARRQEEPPLATPSPTMAQQGTGAAVRGGRSRGAMARGDGAMARNGAGRWAGTGPGAGLGTGPGAGQVLQRFGFHFGFQFSSPQPTPLSTGHSLSAPPSDESVEPSGPYPELVGCLMYLMTCTRPDLAYPLSLLARYVAPGRHQKGHWYAAKRVLRYLCSTLGMGLVLGGRGPVVLTGHTDASWVDDSATQRSS